MTYGHERTSLVPEGIATSGIFRLSSSTAASGSGKWERSELLLNTAAFII